jgi:cell wall-associated NlpC family hydrolase
MTKIELLIQYSMRFVGKPYIWGDKSPVLGGFDCSGFVCEVLRFAGLVGNKEVLNAQSLFNRFAASGRMVSHGAGALAFYGKGPTQITHVALMVSEDQILEAGGGDSTTTSEAAADGRNAMVRGRTLRYRGDLVAVMMPTY